MKNVVRVIVLGLACMITWHSCVNHEEIESAKGDSAINLRWVKAYTDETRNNVVTGLMWNLSYLGATLPKGSVQAGIVWRNESQCVLDVSKLGFTPSAREAWQTLFRELKKSDEYRVNNSIDIGRFVMLTLNSAYHYYAVTGAPKHMADYVSRYQYQEVRGAITNSAVSLAHRSIQISAFTNVAGISFIAIEGTGSLVEGTFTPAEYEMVDIMPNGQQRFILYDAAGNLKAAASPELTHAGKPAKCLWCHEINLQKLFMPNEAVAGYLTDDQFDDVITTAKTILSDYRNSLVSDLDFSKTQDHTYGELLYISFMEPSASRLANEWNMSVEDVQKLLGSTPTHQYTEFPFLGDLYYRADVDGLSPYETIRVPDDAREPSVYEPEIIGP